MRPSSSSRRSGGSDASLWVMAAVLLLSSFLRIHRIGEQRVWWDEGWSVWVARFPVFEILRQTSHDVHPPLYFELLHFWRALSGDSEAGLRLLSAFLGVLAVALTYALGRRMARGASSSLWATATGVLAALLLGVSRFAIAWSQEIRMYALATLLAVLSVWAARRVWERGRPGDMAVYVLATTAGLYTLYLFAPVWIAINIAWLVTRRWRSSLDPSPEEGSEVLPRTSAPPLPGSPAPRLWFALQLLIAVLILPWLRYAAGGFLSTASGTPINLADFFHIYWTVLTVGIPVDVAQFNRLTLPALAVLGAAVVALVQQTTNGRRRATDHRPKTAAQRQRLSPDRQAARDLVLLMAILLLPALIVYIVSLPKQNFYNPPFNPRYLVIFTPFYSILLAWGLAALGQWLSSIGGRRPAAGGLVSFLLATLMLAVALVGLRPYHPGRVLIDDYPSLVSTINAYRRPGDAVILYSDTDWPIFAYHHPQAWQGVPHLWSITPETAGDYLAPIWESHDAVWLVTTPYSAAGDPQRHIPAWLAERATAVREFNYKDMALTLFTRAPERAALADTLTVAASRRPLDVSLPGGGRLTGYAQAARDFKSGDAIHLYLYWTAGAAVATEVGLIDADGSIWQPTTVNLPDADALARQQVDILVPPEAPTGPYRFYILDEDGRPTPFGAANVTQKQTEFLTSDDVAIANRVDAQFGDGIRLLGYDLETTTALPGGVIGLTLFWSSDGDVRQRYKVFTHLLGEVFNAETGNFLWGQADNEPAANTRPTTTWRGAEVIVDRYAIPVAANAPPGAYRIEVGLYDALTGERLPLLGGEDAPAADHLILATVEIAP